MGGVRSVRGRNGDTRVKRQSIQPTYDHRETGDRFTVESRLNGRRIGDVTACRDPFVNHRITVGWPDLLRSLVKRKAVVEVTVGGDPQIVDDVLELDADCLTHNSTRRDEWNTSVNDALGHAALTTHPEAKP